ncbi:PPC domain-containing DNA-binding protein [Herbiconiux sp. 11R-BC]|uniref:PPC domain-containing DNA-binding protein n=1 Tax=Herbiconiux sp. 11R-BC TaxID=3111637 RepID=UPI003C01CDF4
MHTFPLTRGRSILVVLEPGDDVLTGVLVACAAHGIARAVVPVFLGAFTSVTLIAADGPVDDDDAPMPTSITLEWVEGSGSATVAPDASGTPVLHLHASVGVKTERGAAYAGHVLAATAHYTVEIVVDEVLGADFARLPDPRAHGLNGIRAR